MIKSNSNSGQILILDNDVMVNLFVLLYDADKTTLNQVISNLGINYTRIWIPSTVKDEFLLKTNDKQRTKRLRKIHSYYPYISICPIKVSKNEIITMIGNIEKDAGEADAILQAAKAKTTQKIFFEDIVFFTNDNGGQKRAKEMGIKVLKYKEFRSNLLETGIVIPL
jgi:rRNA-processing protein FCF1